MNPNEVPIPLEKTVVIHGSTIEISIAEKKMSDKEKSSYQKFMAKCISESSGKTDRDAAMSCAVTFERMKEKIMAEDADLEEIKKENDKEEKEEEKEQEGKTLEEKIKLEKKDVKKDKFELKLEKQDLKDDEEYLKELEKKKMEQSKSAQKQGAKMQYREKPKTSTNSINIITVEQINKWEKAEKNENQIQEQKETKQVWKNTIDL